MGKFFVYSREKALVKKDEQGKPIPVKFAADGVTPVEFETETVVLTDSINLNKVIRSFMGDDGSLLVLLDDGHEEIQKQQFIIDPKKPAKENNVRTVKSEQWLQSEIYLKGEDVQRFYDVIEKL